MRLKILFRAILPTMTCHLILSSGRNEFYFLPSAEWVAHYVSAHGDNSSTLATSSYLQLEVTKRQFKLKKLGDYADDRTTVYNS